jgi:uncharacterized glyoxalase superfamily protein PhnB
MKPRVDKCEAFLIFAVSKPMVMLKFKCPLLAVTDMEKAITFYEEVIGDRVAFHFGENVQFEGGFALQEMKKWRSMIHDAKVRRNGNDAELYFEEDDFDGFIDYLKDFSEILYVHGVEEAPWGQRIVRFYDPDFHIIEVGEPMDAVIKRLLDSGMTVEQVSEKSQYPIEYVKRFAK